MIINIIIFQKRVIDKKKMASLLRINFFFLIDRVLKFELS